MRNSERDHNRSVTRSRRSVLAAAGAAAGIGALTPLLGGCDLLDPSPEPPLTDPLTGLYQQTLILAARYDELLREQPALASQLGQVRDAHHAHVAALAAIMDPRPSAPPNASGTAAPPTSGPPFGTGTPTPTGTAKPSAADLRKAEKSAHAEAVRACLAAPSSRALLLGEIAAARATHLEVLR